MAREVLSVDVIGHGWEKIREEFRKTAAASKTHGGTATNSLSKIAQAAGSIPVPMVAAGAAVASAAIAIGVSSIKAASEFESSHVKLQRALKNTKTSWDAQKKAIEEADKAGRDLGFTDTDTENSLAQMTTATGSATKALSLLQLAQDIARFKNVDLATASTAVAKASEGQLKPLKALGIDLPVAAGGAKKLQDANVKLFTATLNVKDIQQKIHDGRLKGQAAADALRGAANKLHDAQDRVNTVSHTGDTIIDALSKRMKGQASDAAKTLEGRQRHLSAEWDHAKVTIGQVLMPALDGIATWIDKTGIPQVHAFIDAWVKEFPHIGNAAIDTVNVVGGALNQLIRVINDVIQGLNDINLNGRDIAKIPTVGSLGHIGGASPPLKLAPVPGGPGFIGPVGPNTFRGPQRAVPGAASGAFVRHRRGGVMVNVGEGGKDEVIEPLDRASARGAVFNVTVNMNAPVMGANAAYNRELALAISNQLVLLSGKGGRGL